MHPLSTFPTLLTFGLLAPLLLRLVVGFIIISMSKERRKKPLQYLSLVYIAVGILIIAGLYTQITALIGVAVIKFDFWMDRKHTAHSKDRLIIDVLLCAILLSLLFTGPGLLAFDMPL
jgi:uncharacterized membrane protein YphA (DoxX/SURF4 family)